MSELGEPNDGLRVVVMRVLLLSRYGAAGASSRYRAYQFIPGLASYGIEVEPHPFFDDAYVEHIYSGREWGARNLAASIVRRIIATSQSGRFDLVWLGGEVLPWMPRIVETALCGLRVPYVVDYDDAIFHRYDQHPRSVVRAILGRKIDRIMRDAACVVVGNGYLRERARAARAKQVVCLPTVIDLARYPPPATREAREFVIGWIGSPSTQHYLELVRPALARLGASAAVRVETIGVRSSFQLHGVRHTKLKWSEDTEVDQMSRFSVGIMPVDDTPWSRGKCGFKLVQYMACGLPVVASPVGINRELVGSGERGFLASSQDEWCRALEALHASAKLRGLLGKAGRLFVETNLNVDVVLPRLAAVLRGAAAQHGGFTG